MLRSRLDVQKAWSRIIAGLAFAAILSIQPPSTHVTGASALDENSEIDYVLNLNGTNTAAESAARVIDSSAFTVEAWFYSAAGNSTGTRTIISQYVSSTSRLYILLESNRLRYSWGSSTLTEIPRAEYALPHDRWVHLALTRSSTSSGVAILYADGIEVSRSSGSGTNPNGILRVGNAASSFAGGQVDQVKIWNVALDASQIRQSMHAYSDTWGGATQTGLVAHYDFNEGSGSTIYDRVGSKDLTVSNATTFTHLATETTSGNDKIITFPRTYLPSVGGWTVPAGVTAVRSLVVAGGGGGGSDEGGGGGAGGFIETSTQNVSGVEPVVVGQGGLGGWASGSTTQDRRTTSGQDSYFGTTPRVTTTGGGAGGDATTVTPSVRNGLSGGSGGGGAGENVTSSGGSGLSPQGNNGASRASTVAPGGGGGGAGAAATERAGGEGRQSTITGVTPAPYYAAGGSGGCGNDCSATQASTNSIGGAGGGTSDGTLGAANTGSGGGGGKFSGAVGSGASGGSGVVIIRYTEDQIPPTLISFSTNANDGTYKIGDTINITATFSEDLRANSAIVVSLNSGVSLTLTTNVVSSTLSANYLIQAGEQTTSLDVLSFSITSAKDPTGNDLASTALPAINISTDSNIRIDAIRPAITSSSTSLKNSYNSRVVIYAITFNENINSTTLPSSLSIPTGWTSSISGSSNTYLVTLNRSDSENGNISLLIDLSTVEDLVGNTGSGTQTLTLTLNRQTQVTNWIRFLWGEQLQKF